MKKSILILFVINGKTIEQIDDRDIDINGIEVFKSAIAASHKVPYNDIEVETREIEIHECTGNWIVREDGVLMAKVPNPYASFLKVEGLRPALDINKEELMEEYLELISQKDFVNAITFYYICS